jgi:hypothetical protein
VSDAIDWARSIPLRGDRCTSNNAHGSHP